MSIQSQGNDWKSKSHINTFISNYYKYFYVKLFTPLHFSRRKIVQLKRKSSIILKKISQKKVRTGL